METIYITKKINENEYMFDNLIKKFEYFLDENNYVVAEYPIKLVFEEGITEVNEKIINKDLLKCSVVEIVYPSTLIELPCISFVNLEKITLPNNLKEIFSWNLCGHLCDINLHNVEVINAGAFHFRSNLNTICIYPCMKKIEWCAFEDANIKRLIFFNTNAEINQSAFRGTKIDKLYCLNKNLLNLLYSDFSKKMADLINIKDEECINYTLENLFFPVKELTISQDLVFDFVNILMPLNNYFSKKLVNKLIIDCPNDFYHNLLYKDKIETLKEKLCCEVILSHDYVVENFEEVKDIYEEPNLDKYSKKISDKCNIILDSCSNEKLKEKVLNYLISIVKKNNVTIITEENYRYSDYNNICLSTNSSYYSKNTFVNKLDDILNKINFLNHNILINNEILSLLDDIEELISEVNITNEELSYLDGSLYSDIYKYLYVLELVDFDLRQKYRAKLLKIISKYKTLIYENIDNNINDFLNINVLYKDINEFEFEFRNQFFKELSSFYKKYFESKGINVLDVANGIASIYDNAKDRQRNIYYKVITELIEEIKMLNYGKDKSIIEKLDNIISINLNELEECKLYDIIKELTNIKYFLQYKENKLKEKGLFKVVKKL